MIYIFHFKPLNKKPSPYVVIIPTSAGIGEAAAVTKERYAQKLLQKGFGVIILDIVYNTGITKGTITRGPASSMGALSSIEYLKSRTSKQVIFTINVPKEPIYIDLNPALHSWTIENLVKNAIDAMKGKGKLDITIEQQAQIVKLKIKDSGKGIPKNQFKKVFEPGFTTKKRGWGLGLSLTKRIVKEYHKGRIKVAQSEIGKGTTMQLTFKIK